VVRRRGIEGSEAGLAVLARPGTEHVRAWRGRVLASTADLLGQISEYEHAHELAQSAIRIGKDLDDPRILLEAMQAASYAMCRVGDIATARVVAHEAVALARSTMQPGLLADAMGALDRVDIMSGNENDAEFAQEALELCRQLGDHFRTSMVCNNLGSMAIARGDFAAARSYLEESVALSEMLASAPLDQTFNLGLADLLDGNLDDARSRFARCMVISRRVGDPSMIAYTMLGMALASAGVAAAELLGAADALLGALEELLEPMESELREAAVARLRTELGGEAFEQAYDRGRGLSRDEAIARVLAKAPAQDHTTA
jgi:tetratricopeptide (TPR) repeat protein